MKKLLKFGIASLSLAVLAGSGFNQMVQADEVIADALAPTVLDARSETEVLATDTLTSTTDTPETTEAVNRTRYVLSTNGILSDRDTLNETSLGQLLTNTPIDITEPVHLDLPVVPSDKQETDSLLDDLNMDRYRGKYSALLESANFRTLSDLEAFEATVKSEIDELGATVPLHGYELHETFALGNLPSFTHRAHYDRGALKNLMTSLGYAEGSYEFNEKPISYRFRVMRSGIPGLGAGAEHEARRQEIVAWGRNLLERANQAAAKSWEVAPTPVAETPKQLTTAAVPVQVEVSGQDGKVITGIEARQVTDSAILDKLPEEVPQADTVLYDIKTVDQEGQFVQISEPAKVTLNLDPSRKVLGVVYFLPETGAVEELPFTLSEDGTQVSFDVTHFSQYGVVYEPVSKEQPQKTGAVKTINIGFNYLDAAGKTIKGFGDVISLKPGEHYDLRPALPGYKLVSDLESLTYDEADEKTTYIVKWQVSGDQQETKEVEATAPKDLTSDRNKLLLNLDESKLTDEQKGKLAEKIAFAETEKDLADLKAELVKLDKAAEKPADKPVTTPTATAKPVASTPDQSGKAALPATGDTQSGGFLALGVGLTLASLGLAKVRKPH